MGIHVEQVMAEHTGEKSCVDPPIFGVGAIGNEVGPFLEKPGGIVFVHLASQIDIAADPGAEKRIEQGIGTLVPDIKRIDLPLIADVRSEPFQNAFSKHVVGDIGGQRTPPPLPFDKIVTGFAIGSFYMTSLIILYAVFIPFRLVPFTLFSLMPLVRLVYLPGQMQVLCQTVCKASMLNPSRPAKPAA